MDSNRIVADYSLDALLSSGPSAASIDKVLSQYEAYDEEIERKRRERMLVAQRAMAQSGHVSAPRGRNHVFGIHADGTPIDSDAQDAAISDGLSLAMGSVAHKVYVQNRSGMDQFERSRADMAAIGFGKKSDMQAPGPDEFHEERYEELAGQDADTAQDNELQLSKGDMAVSDKLEDYVIKGEQAERILDLARSRASATATSRDDTYVDGLEKSLEHAVSDVSKSDLLEEEISVDRVLDSMEGLSAGM